MKRQKFIPHKRDRNLEKAFVAGYAARLVEKPVTKCPNLLPMFAEAYATLLMDRWMDGWNSANRKLRMEVQS